MPDDAQRMMRLHVDGTRACCEAAARAGVQRIVLASTSGTVAVSRRADEILDETSPTPRRSSPRWPYYARKIYQEEAARRACGDRHRAGGGEPEPAARAGRRSAVLDAAVLQFLAREIPPMPPGGLNFVDARDAAALLPAAMERGTPGERYLLGGPNWTFAEFFGRLERLTKVPGPHDQGARQAARCWRRARRPRCTATGAARRRIEPQSVEMAEYFWYFDSGKAARELGFIPRDATDTLFDTVTYIRANFLGNGALGEGGDGDEGLPKPLDRRPDRRAVRLGTSSRVRRRRRSSEPQTRSAPGNTSNVAGSRPGVSPSSSIGIFAVGVDGRGLERPHGRGADLFELR